MEKTMDTLSVQKKVRKQKARKKPHAATKKDLRYLNAGGTDPIAALLFTMSGKKIFLVLTAGLVICLLPFAVAWQENTLYNPTMELSLLMDYGWHLLTFASIALLLMNTMYFSEFPNALVTLRESKVFDLDKPQWDDFIEDARKIFRNKYLTLATYSISLIVAGIVAIHFMVTDSDRWHRISFSSSSYAAGWASLPAIFLLYYLIVVLVFRTASVYYVLSAFFENKATIQPLHPDNCGGLSPLGRLSMKLNCGVFLFGIISLLAVGVNVKLWELPYYHYLNIMIVGAYFVGSFILFFMPLFSAHSKMKSAKDATIQIISDYHSEKNRQILALLHDKGQLTKQMKEEIDALHEIYERAAKMPVYPFNFKTVTTYLGSIITPVIIFAIQRMIELYCLPD